MKKFLFLFFFLIFNIDVFAQFDPGKDYMIESRSSGRFLYGNDSTSLTFDQKKSSEHLNLWKIINIEDNIFFIKNSGDSLMLSVNNGAEWAGAALICEAQNNLDRQKWIITEEYGFYRIKNKKSGFVITVDSDYPETTDPNPDLNYAAIYKHVGNAVQRANRNQKNQEFEIEPVIYTPTLNLAVAQLGWKPGDDKQALIVSSEVLNNTGFTIKDNAGNEVMTGNFNLFPADLDYTFSLYYYLADLTSITQPGNYMLYTSWDSISFIVADDIYLNIPYAKGGTIKFKEIFNGFWKYNSFYPQGQTLLEATVTLDSLNKSKFNFSGNDFYLPPYGWFDAHSRDSKLSHSAKVVSDMAQAYFITTDADNRLQLYNNLEFGVKHFLLTQNDDGSWPVGKVRDADASTSYDNRYYHWVINKDVNTAARCVRALASTYNVFKNSDPTLAAEILDKAKKGWEFVINNEELVDENVKFRGFTVDILAAAIEMAYVTGESQYFDKADEMIDQSEYIRGIFRKKDGSWPAETGNRFTEMNEGCAFFVAKYYSIARTKVMKQKVRDLMEQLTSYWKSLERTPQDIPRVVISRPTAFGNVLNLIDYAYMMLSAAVYLHDEEAFQLSKKAFNVLTGLNAYSTSYIVGLGNKTPTVNFLKRSFENGIGAVIPGFTNTDEMFLFQDFTSYKNTEGGVTVSAPVFYILSAFDHYTPAESPVAGDLKINEVKSDTSSNATSFVEIYNNSDKNINLSGVILEMYALTGNTPDLTLALSGILSPHGYYVIATDSSAFYGLYEFEPDTVMNGMIISENTGGFSLIHQSDTLDYFNDVPNPGQTVTNNAIYIRKGYDNEGTDLTQHWHNAGLNINGTPGKDNNVFWETDQYAEACDKYLWDVNGTVYTESGTYQCTISNVYNIDSLITLHLTININKNVTQIDNLLIADEPNATYQWLNCDRNYEPVEGATEQSFEPLVSGHYSVRITKNGCSGISDCYDIITSIAKQDNPEIKVFPNPTTGNIKVELDKNYGYIHVTLRDIQGRAIASYHYTNCTDFNIYINNMPGIYLLDIIHENSRTVCKVIKL
ncbi:MAG: T9SS type A sorting domain-containing protein [Chlorobi bacterium]|nr:T9SS type A sorting domain-containing protein [Chlorobiota bacterium]